MAYDPRVLKALRDNAARLPDQRAREYYVASALVESNLNPRAVGDGGNSGGLFQENSYGRGSGIPMADRFNPNNNARRAADEFLTFYNRGARGADLAYRAQRPADRASYLSKLQQRVAEARQILGGGAGTGTGPLNAPVTSAGGDSSTVSRGAQPVPASSMIAQALSSGKTGTRQTADLANSVVMAALQGAGQPALSEAEGTQVNPTGLDNQIGGGNQGAVAAARTRLGTPYSWGGGTPSGPTRGFGRGANTTGFDCSSLVQYAWAKAGVTLPRVTYDQIKVGRGIDPRNMASWKPGDLVFPHSGHVQMYIGNGKVIHAPRTGGHVEIVPVGKAMAVRRPKG